MEWGHYQTRHIFQSPVHGCQWSWLGQRIASRKEEPAQLIASHQWDSIDSVDSVFTELQGLHDALSAFAHDLAGTQVLHRTDSQSTYWVVAGQCRLSQQRETVYAGQTHLVVVPAVQHLSVF